MDRIDVSHLLDALGKIADNSLAAAESTANVEISLDNLHGLLDEGLSQINDNLGRIADALEAAREDGAA